MPVGAWHCEWIFVTEVFPGEDRHSSKSWYFPCNQWLRGDGRSPVMPFDFLPLDVAVAPPLALREPEIIEEASRQLIRSFKRIEKTGQEFQVNH